MKLIQNNLLFLLNSDYNGIKIQSLGVDITMMNYLVTMDRKLRITILLSAFFGSFLFFFITANGWFILLGFIFMGLLVATNISHSKNYSNIMEKSLEKALINCNFVADSSYLSDDFLSGIALNELERTVAIFKRKDIEDEFIPNFISFDDILEVSIKEDDTIITHTSKSSAIGNAMVGGVLFGGIGAVVGGLSGEKIGYAKIYKSTLSIVVNDLKNPIQDIHFLNSKMLVDRDSEMYQNIYYEMNKWHKKISVILNRNEKLNTRTI